MGAKSRDPDCYGRLRINERIGLLLFDMASSISCTGLVHLQSNFFYFFQLFFYFCLWPLLLLLSVVSLCVWLDLFLLINALTVMIIAIMTHQPENKHFLLGIHFNDFPLIYSTLCKSRCGVDHHSIRMANLIQLLTSFIDAI